MVDQATCCNHVTQQMFVGCWCVNMWHHVIELHKTKLAGLEHIYEYPCACCPNVSGNKLLCLVKALRKAVPRTLQGLEGHTLTTSCGFWGPLHCHIAIDIVVRCCMSDVAHTGPSVLMVHIWPESLRWLSAGLAARTPPNLGRMSATCRGQRFTEWGPNLSLSFGLHPAWNSGVDSHQVWRPELCHKFTILESDVRSVLGQIFTKCVPNICFYFLPIFYTE